MASSIWYLSGASILVALRARSALSGRPEAAGGGCAARWRADAPGAGLCPRAPGSSARPRPQE
eukprot:3674603-Alexandrium_andersonii.AAC.1